MIPDTSTKAEAAGRAHAHALVALEGLPVALVVAVTAALAWAGGSILSGAWLGWESLVGLALAAVLISGAAAAPPRAAVIGLTGLFGLAGWDALSLRWSPVPSLARDEALLVLFYVLAALIVAVSLRTEDGRTIAAALVVAAAGALGVATAIELALGAHPENLYDGGRLSAPIGYANGQAAAFALAFWPAVALAASRRLPVAARAVLFACAGVCIAGWIATQSKAAGVGLAAGGILLFAVSRERLRLLVPAVLAAAIGAAAYRPVTAPYRAVEAGAAAAARHAGRSWLLVAAEAVGVGLAYAAADRTIVVAPRVRRLAAIAVAVLVAAGAAGGAAAIALHVRHPESYVAAKWHAFKWPPASETGSSHFETLGSDRYDMWRVAFDAFRAHPIAGIGARGFGVLYLQKASIQRSPARSHSLELDALSETGIIGFALLALGLGGLFVAAAAGSRTRAVSAAIVASAVGWL
ncbi:MAG: O-antigen ligase family protein, partial [Actinobacteria bacterium]|nr:O-antigen ligase family protein [Actinomycetota bacterium]